MTNEEIKNMLEICTSRNCDGCILDDDIDCINKLLTEAKKYIYKLEDIITSDDY